jgi:FAD:protein FMN transferase
MYRIIIGGEVKSHQQQFELIRKGGKNLTSTLFMIIICFGFISSCGSPKEQLIHQQIFTFGTLVDIAIWTDKTEKAKALIEQLNSDFERQHRDWHSSKKGSLLANVNQNLQQGKTATLDASIYELLKIATTFSIQSEGLFNPAIGQLVDLWHFDQLEHQSMDENIDSVKPPSKQQLQTLIDLRPSMTDLLLTEQLSAPQNTGQASLNSSLQLKSKNPAIKLDFGAFAKGYAVDQAVKTIRQSGFKHAMINAGGDIKVIGKKAGKFWNIGIRNPFYQQQTDFPVIASIKLKNNESIMTSGDYERFFIYQGKRYHHIIDPRNGYPANSFHSVTIVHDDAALADAAATAIFIAGPHDWQKIAIKMGIDQVMLMTQSSELIISSKLKPRLALRTEKMLNLNIKTKIVELNVIQD